MSGISSAYAGALEQDVWIRNVYLPFTAAECDGEPIPSVALAGNGDLNGEGNPPDSSSNLSLQAPAPPVEFTVNNGWCAEYIFPNKPPTSGFRYAVGSSEIADLGYTAAVTSGWPREQSNLALFVPNGWSVRIKLSQNTEDLTYTNAGFIFVLVNENFNSTNTLQSIVFTRVAMQGSLSPAIDWPTKHVKICMGEPMVVAGVQPAHLVPSNINGCDPFMEAYCADSANRDTLACSCIVEQVALQAQYPNSVTQVTCLGKRCGLGGYRTQAMLTETCNIDFCSAFIDSTESIHAERGTTTIDCAGQAWSLNSKGQAIVNGPTPPSTATPVDTRRGATGIPWYAWVFGIIAILVAGLFMYLVVRGAQLKERRVR